MMHLRKLIVFSAICVSCIAAEGFKIISEPKVVEATLGQKVTLPCEYKGRPESTYRLWFHDQNVISINEKVIYRKDDFELDGMNLIVNVSKPALADKYICKFNDPEWSNVTHLILLLGPPVVETDVKQIDVRENGTISIHCTSSSAPKPVITYKKKDSDMDLSGFVGTDGALRISNATRKYAGVYECVGKNGHSPDGMQNITVKYAGRPDVSVAIQWHNLNSDTEKSVEITCKVAHDGEGDLKVLWKKGDNQQLQTSDKFEITNKPSVSTLRINSISKDLFDNYTCFASNSYGEGSDSVEISSLPIKPIVDAVPQETSSDLTLTTVSPYRVSKFIVTLTKANGQPETFEIPVSENEVVDVDGKYTSTKRIPNLSPDTEYSGTAVAETVMSEKSSQTQFHFRTPSAHTASSSAQLLSSFALVLFAAIFARA